jgi:hypothetical protein
VLATVEDVKRKLELAVTDESHDDALELVTATANDRVLALCRHVATDETRVQVFEDAGVGDVLTLERRPVAAVALHAKAAGGDWYELEADVIDADKGKVAVVGSSGWPFYRDESAKPWPFLRATYEVSGVGEDDDAPAALRDSAAALAAYWYRQHLAGPVTESTVGAIRQTVTTAAEPPWLGRALADYMDDDAGTGGATCV